MKAKTRAINIDEDDVFEIAIGSIKSVRSRISSADNEDALKLSEILDRGYPIPLQLTHPETPEDRQPTGFLSLSC